jgi:hypothetical protein
MYPFQRHPTDVSAQDELVQAVHGQASLQIPDINQVFLKFFMKLSLHHAMLEPYQVSGGEFGANWFH